MPTAVETTAMIQAKVFESIEVGQQAVLASVSTWAEAVEVLSAKLPELAFSEPMKPTQFFDATVGFTEKLMASQREFTTKLFEAYMPATRAATAATRSAKAAAPKS